MPRRGDYGELSATARAHDTTPQALLQRRRAKDGRCAQCGAKREKGYTWFCQACAHENTAHNQARVARLYAQGLCRCGQPRGDHRRCDDCRERENRARRKRR